jgi:translocation and assembly module TamA
MKNRIAIKGKVATFALALVFYIPLTLPQVGAAEQKTLTLYIQGVSGKLLDNVVAYLGIEQLASETASEQKPLESLIEETPILGPLASKAKEVIRETQQPTGQYQLQISESRLRWFHTRAEENIRRALQPFGYYEPTIETRLEKTQLGWTAYYRINPGPPVRIATLDLQILGEGADDPAFQQLLAEFPLAEGDILVQPFYAELKRKLQFLATERGYFDARLEKSQIRINPQTHSVAVILHFDTAQRYRFGQIQFSDTALTPEFLQRYVQIQPGDPYDSAALLNLQSNLIGSNYFSQVEVNAPAEQAIDNRVPIIVKLAMRDSRQLSFGLGYGTDTGIRGRVGFEYRYLNRWGHRLKTLLLGSQIKYGMRFVYIIPGANPTTDQYGLNIGLTREDSDVKDTFSAFIGGNWRKQFGLWEQILALRYGAESFRFDGSRKTSTLLMPSADWTRTDADDILNVRRGSRLWLRLRGAYEPLLSALSFFQPTASGKLIRALGEHGRFIVRSDLGTTVVSNFDALPASLRFYAGGDNSVRGYELDKIGPRDREGNVIGGKNLLVGSLEYEHRIWGKWSAAAFVDSGDAFDDSPDFKTGVGVGMRWQSPVGPIRVDVAHGLEDPGDTIRLHISIGPEL